MAKLVNKDVVTAEEFQTRMVSVLNDLSVNFSLIELETILKDRLIKNENNIIATDQYGCHVEMEEGISDVPDMTCVFDGKGYSIGDCSSAIRLDAEKKGKWDCKHWRKCDG